MPGYAGEFRRSVSLFASKSNPQFRSKSQKEKLYFETKCNLSLRAK